MSNDPMAKARAFSMGVEPLEFRRRYVRPTRGDVDSSVPVAIEHPACCTGEHQGIPMADHTAPMTGLRRVGRIDGDAGHAGRFGFVRDELPKLEERPGLLSVAVALPDRGARSNAG